MSIKLSDHFTYKRLIRFVLPPIGMMIFTSVYGVIDGLFISNCVGSDAFTAINLIMPFLMILGTIGFMLGTGGSAIVSKTLGENKPDTAKRYFSFIIYCTAGCGVIITLVAFPFIHRIAALLGADETIIDDCTTYGKIILAGISFFMLQNVFQAFFTTAEKPTLGFIVTLAAGCTNITLDALFVALLNLGVAGAAWATIMSQAVGAIIPLFYFGKKNGSSLNLTKCAFYTKVLLHSCLNGSSEFVSNISGSVVSMVFNMQLMNLYGKDGVAAYGVIMYVSFIFVAIFIGYAIGTAPIIGFNYGADNRRELKNILGKSLLIMLAFGIFMTGVSALSSSLIAKIFFREGTNLFLLTKRALLIYSLSFAFAGFGIFGSAMFTALGNGVISAIISFLRTLVFQISAVLVLPLVFGGDGIWVSMLAAEILSTIITITMIFAKRVKYGYI